MWQEMIHAIDYVPVQPCGIMDGKIMRDTIMTC